MQELLIIYILFLITAVTLQVLLYKRKNVSKNIYKANLLLCLVLAATSYTSLPSNYIIGRVIALWAGVMSLVSVSLVYTNDKFVKISKLLLSLSILISFIQLIA